MDRRKFNASLAVGAASALAPFGIARAQPSVLKIAC